MSKTRTNKLLVSGAVLSGLFLTGMATTAKADSPDLGESNGPISQSNPSNVASSSSDTATQTSSANASSTNSQTTPATANQQLNGATGSDGFNTEVVFTRPVSRSAQNKAQTYSESVTSSVHATQATAPTEEQQLQKSAVADSPADLTEGQPTATAQAETPTQKTELSLEPTQSTIKSGQAASFDLKLAVAAITQNLNRQRLVINVPTNVKLVAGTDLTINGVTPTLSSDGTQYTYEFPGPNNGLSVSKQFLFDTADAGLPNGSTLTTVILTATPNKPRLATKRSPSHLKRSMAPLTGWLEF